MTWEFGHESDPVAKKNHICDQCQSEIQIGEKYIRFYGKWDGDIATYKAHLDCEQVAKKVWEMADLDIDEGVNLRDVELDNAPWIIRQFPQVAKRLGLQAQSVA